MTRMRDLARLEDAVGTAASPTHGQAVTIPCPHCNNRSVEGCVGDGLCHHGTRKIGGLFIDTPLIEPAEWRSDEQCRKAYRDLTGERMDIVPCRYCNGYGFLLIGPRGTPKPMRLPEEQAKRSS